MKRTAFVRGLQSVLCGLTFAGALPAADLRPEEIMERNFFTSRVSGLHVESKMTLVNERGQKRERINTTLIKLQSNGVDSRFLVRFLSPNDINGTSFLQIEHSDGDDDLWIYLPALRKSRRLVANNKKDSFVGSDFSYGDISLPKVDTYRHTLLRTEKVGEWDCYVIESIPGTDKVKANSGYSRKITWVRQDNFLEAKVEYHDLSDRLLKTQLTARHELVEPDKNRWFALDREMQNHRTGHRTVITTLEWKAAPDLPDEQFSTRYIERE